MSELPISELNNEQKFTLYTIGQITGGLKTDVHFQKLIFLTTVAVGGSPKEMGYIAYDYGPYSIKVHEIGNDLVRRGFATKNSDRGCKARKLSPEETALITPKNDFNRFAIKRVADLVSRFTYNEIILYTYVKHPKYAVNSTIIKDVLDRRLDTAINMVMTNKVSVGCGAELSGLSFQAFDREMQRIREVLF
ncbi:MAG: hypothetical protein FWH47_01565 [Methanomassiliicoccaceae archaeon]|nr:hypothetical protein [Methanomassiliicoccaceae archaeon]